MAENSFVCSTAGTTLCTLTGREYYKYNDQPAICGYFYLSNNFTGPLLVSEQQDAVVYTSAYDPDEPIQPSGSFEAFGRTWYVSNMSAFMGGNLTTTGGSYSHKVAGSYENSTEAGKQLLADYYASRLSRYKVKRKRRNYYKYSNTYDFVDLAKSDNTAHISSPKFVVNSVTEWATTQRYNLPKPIRLAKAKAIANVTYIQGNAGWRTTITGHFSDGDSVILSTDFGYGGSGERNVELDFKTNRELIGITIYAICYRRHYQYCYGSIEISIQGMPSILSSQSDYDFTFDDVYTYVAKTKKRAYYKYVYGEPVDKYTPAFASQAQATSGVDGVKMTTAQGYWQITTATTIATNNNNVITFDVGELSNGIKSFAYNAAVVGGSYPAMVMNNIQCSHDGNSWTTISSRWGGRGTTVNTPFNVPYPNNYRYLRFTTSNDDGRHGNGGVNSFRMLYNYIPRTVTAGTIDDYDYYVDDVKTYKPQRTGD